MSLGLTFPGTLKATRVPFCAVCTECVSSWISSTVTYITPVVGPVMSILSPTENSAASQVNSATPSFEKYFTPLPTYTLRSVALEP